MALTTPMVTPHKSPTRKVLAFTGSGATLGPSVAELLIYLVEEFGARDLPDRIEKIVYTLAIVLAGLAAAYAIPPAADDAPVVDAGH